MTDSFSQLQTLIRTASAKVGIIGLGYVGLPLGRALTAGGFKVLGFDVDPVKIQRLKKGESYIGHISAAAIREMQSRGFEPTDDFTRLKEPDVIIVCVPTPLTETREPDLTYVVNSAKSIAAKLRK